MSTSAAVSCNWSLPATQESLGMTGKEMSEVFKEWNKGELDSFLIEITSDILGKAALRLAAMFLVLAAMPRMCLRLQFLFFGCRLDF